MNPLPYDTLTLEVREHVAWLTLNRPAVLNAMNRLMRTELADAWRWCAATDDVRVVVLRGAGPSAFTSGADRGELDGHDGTGAVPGAPGAEVDGEAIGPKANGCWKPVVAAVHGIACGGAFYLLGEADVIIASDEASFFDPHVTFGQVSGAESIHMANRMPFGEVLRMQLTGSYERLGAQRAREIGLVSEVVTPAELEPAARAVARAIAQNSPSAVQGTLRALWASRDMPRPTALAMAPHFLAMADIEDWLAGQATFTLGQRVEHRTR